MTFCAAAAASGILLMVQSDFRQVVLCEIQQCDRIDTAVTRALICFAAILPSLYVNWIRWCASATIHHHQNTMSFRANGLLLCSNIICLIMAAAAIGVSVTHNIIGFEVFGYVQMKLV